jgi:hypothetical protein
VASVQRYALGCVKDAPAFGEADGGNSRRGAVVTLKR